MRSSILLLALAPLTIGCGAGWQQATTLSPGPMPTRQQVQVWSGGAAYRWHVVTVTQDSITGVPFTESPACQTCRVGLSRTVVDSVRLGNPVAGFWKTVGLGLGTSLVILGIWCEAEGGCHLGD